MMEESKKGILLINLGTPQSPSVKDVKTYLTEFLTDPRVINLPWLFRQLLVRCMIIPLRCRQSAASYQKIWTDQGSPLMVHSLDAKNLLQKELGENYVVSLGMRYQDPSIKNALEELKKAQVSEILVIPLFPQYASATTGSVHQKVMEEVKCWEIIPSITFINSFYNHPAFIQAYCDLAKNYQLDNYDHLLFSFHGLPEKQVKKADSKGVCKFNTCCQKIERNNQFCYRAQCYSTAQTISQALSLSSDQYSICFQSRLGKDPWIQPYIQDAITQLAEQGKKRILVFCPSFTCDCLETIFEIGVEYKHLFIQKGGNVLDLVEGLNSHLSWISCLKTIVKEHETRQPLLSKSEELSEYPFGKLYL